MNQRDTVRKYMRLPIWGFYRNLFPLIRGCRENPMLRGTAPHRRGWWLWLSTAMFFLGVWGSALALIGTLYYYFISSTAQRYASMGVPWCFALTENRGALYTICSTIAALAAGPAVLFFGWYPRSSEELDELRVTLMTPREISFGALYWSIRYFFLALLPFYLFMVLVELLSLAAIAIYGEKVISFSFIDIINANLSKHLFFPFWAMGTGIWCWLVFRRHRWLTVLFTPPLAFSYFLFVQIPAGFFDSFFLEYRILTADFSYPLLLPVSRFLFNLFLFGISTAFYLWLCGRFAALLYQREVDQDSLTRASWLFSVKEKGEWAFIRQVGRVVASEGITARTFMVAFATSIAVAGIGVYFSPNVVRDAYFLSVPEFVRAVGEAVLGPYGVLFTASLIPMFAARRVGEKRLGTPEFFYARRPAASSLAWVGICSLPIICTSMIIGLITGLAVGRQFWSDGGYLLTILLPLLSTMILQMTVVVMLKRRGRGLTSWLAPVAAGVYFLVVALYGSATWEQTYTSYLAERFVGYLILTGFFAGAWLYASTMQWAYTVDN